MGKTLAQERDRTAAQLVEGYKGHKWIKSMIINASISLK